MKYLLACAVLGALTAFGYDASTISSVDWSAQSGTYTVLAGVTNLVTEADIDDVNALEQVKFGDAASALLFTSTTPPAVLFGGPGTVIKEGSASWTLSRVQTDFRGNWDIREGAVAVGQMNGNAQTLVASSSSSWCDCWIRSGATLVYDVAANFTRVNFHLAGTLKVEANSTVSSFHRISLDDDAVIDQTSGKYIFISRPTDDGEPSLELNGHTLTCSLKQNIYLYRGTVTGPGTLRLENKHATTKYGFVIRNRGVSGFVDSTVTLELANDTSLLTQDHPTEPQLATLVVEGLANFYHTHNTASVPACDTLDAWCWDGPISLPNEESELRVYASKDYGANSTIRLGGTITGLGKVNLCGYSSTAPTATYQVNGANKQTGGLILGWSATSQGNYVLQENGLLEETPVTLKDGATLTVEGADDSKTFLKVIASGGENALALQTGANVTITTLENASSGTIDITTAEGASVKILNFAGQVGPAWLTVNGCSVRFAVDGSPAKDSNAWKSPVSGDWNDAANWSENAVPDASKLVEVAAEGEYAVSVNGAVSIAAYQQAYATLNVAAPMTFSGEAQFGDSAVAKFVEGASATFGGGLVLQGGSLDFSGTATVGVADTIKGSGSLVLAGESALQTQAPLTISAVEADDELSIAVRDNATFINSTLNRLYLGDAIGGTFNVDYDSAASSVIGYSVMLGRGNGIGNLTVRQGTVMTGNGGFEIGCDNVSSSPETGLGVLKVFGAKISTSPQAHAWNVAWAGIAVGNGLTANNASSLLRGRLEIGEGATVELDYGSPGIGLGRAQGVVLQNGGVYSFSSKHTYSTNPTLYKPVVIGYAGGDGAYILSNGTFAVKASAETHNTVFVGGCLAEDLNRVTALYSRVTPGDGTATGLLAVRGGAMTAAQSDVVVGKDGTGVFELGGTGAATVGAVEIKATGTLVFAPADGATYPLLTSDSLAMAEGSALKIDMRGLSKPRAWTKLAAISGEVSAADATVDLVLPDGWEAKDCQVVFEHGGEKGVWFRKPPTGILLIIR